jgi:hypothetical protein
MAKTPNSIAKSDAKPSTELSLPNKHLVEILMRVLGPGEKQSAVARTLGIPEEDFSE